MAWLKSVLLDIAITIFIALATTGVLPWAQWVVWVYTPFMLALKALAFFAGGFGQVRRKAAPAGETPPQLFFHALYAINLALLATSGWWITAGQWALIWIFSVLIDRRA